MPVCASMSKKLKHTTSLSDEVIIGPKYSRRDIREIIDESEALQRVPVSRRTWYSWRRKGLIPFIKPKGTRRTLYIWENVLEAMSRMQQGGSIET